LVKTRLITVNGRRVGIARLCDAIADVQARGLTRDDEIKAAVIRRVEETSFIPDPLRAAYADALLAECRVVTERAGRGAR